MKTSTSSATRRRILRLGSVALALVLFTPPLIAEPQQPTKICRIVELNPTPAPQEPQRVFRQALRELGYVPGENILIEDRFAAGSEERLHEAFHAVMGEIRPHRPGLANLAEELGVTRAQLEAAFEKLRDQKEELRDEFAKELADRLNLDVAKVQDALDALHPPHFGRPG